jgi:hypothetical protein
MRKHRDQLEHELSELRWEPDSAFLAESVARIAGARIERRERRRWDVAVVSALAVTAALVAGVVVWAGAGNVNPPAGPGHLSPFIAAACTYGPVVTSVSPSTVSKNASPTTLIVTGGGFSGCTSTPTVTITGGSPHNGATVNSVTVIDDTHLSVVVSWDQNTSPGPRDLTVHTSFGTTTLTNAFSVTG